MFLFFISFRQRQRNEQVLLSDLNCWSCNCEKCSCEHGGCSLCFEAGNYLPSASHLPSEPADEQAPDAARASFQEEKFDACQRGEIRLLALCPRKRSKVHTYLW